LPGTNTNIKLTIHGAYGNL